jgi:hypothetical protein
MKPRDEEMLKRSSKPTSREDAGASSAPEGSAQREVKEENNVEE